MQQNQQNSAPGTQIISNYCEGGEELRCTSHPRCLPTHETSPPAAGLAPYLAQDLPHSSEVEGRSHLAGELNETPRTLYFTSPGTELGDGDFADQSDEELDMVAGPKPSTRDARRSSLSALHCVSAKPYTLGDLRGGDNLAVDETDLRCFTLRLQEDIKSAALFPWIPSTTLSTLASPPSIATTQPAPLASAASSPPTARPNTPSRTNDDVTGAVGPHRTQSNRQLSRKSSMHLKTPSRPINPYQRPSRRKSPPPHPYPAAMIDRSHLRRYQLPKPPEQTVTMKDLIVPNVQFHCGFDPETLVLELTSPPLEDVDCMDDFEPSTTALIQETTITNSPPIFDTSSPGQRAESEESEDMEYDSSDDLDVIGDATSPSPTTPDDPPLQKTASPLTPPPRRSTRASEPRSSSVASYGSRRGPQYSASKPRARHLQPNLVRTNGCQYGCQLLFSTAYEARRHQEDAHGREEAYKLIKLRAEDPNSLVYPQEFRFLIQIGLHASGDKWDASTKARFQDTLARQDVQLDKHAATALLQFAREWTKRYECPRCGTSFSRLDSKKRHYEKQCR